VYLDSQDYSRLAADPILLAELVSLKDSGLAEYVYSSAVISECAPTTQSATQHAIQRSRVIEELCGRKTFLSIDQIIEREFRSLDATPVTRKELVSETGDWFPTVDSLLDELDRSAIFSEMIQEKGYNREQRRMLKSKAMRKGTFRDQTTQALQAQSQETLVEIIQTYPMRPENARVLMNYIAGSTTKKNAELALLESLRDHSWMMQWFQNHHDKLSFVPAFIRAPSTNMHQRMRNTVELSRNLKSPAVTWHQLVAEIIVDVGKDHAQELLVQAPVSAESIYKHCPGFVTLFQTLREIGKDSMGESTRQLKDSDFADAIHSLHAPYVDIFRTDKYMAGKISLSNGAATDVCAKLSQLPAAIRDWSPRT
jgi:hypothetical protein